MDDLPTRLPRPRHHRRHRLAHRPSSLSSGTVKNEINVTPLVDVVLVLLIIFMVVTPMLSRGVKVELPETLHHEKKNDDGKQLVVTVQSAEKVYVEGELVQGDIVPAIKLAMKKHPGEVYVKADRHLEYGVVRQVMEKVHEAGAPSVALGTDEKKGGGK